MTVTSDEATSLAPGGPTEPEGLESAIPTGRLAFTVGVVALGGLLFGFDTGVISAKKQKR